MTTMNRSEFQSKCENEIKIEEFRVFVLNPLTSALFRKIKLKMQ